MENSEYIEYMEEDDKTREKIGIKNENEYFEDDEKIKVETTKDTEYFEDVKKEESETIQRSQLVKILCDICFLSFNFSWHFFTAPAVILPCRD